MASWRDIIKKLSNNTEEAFSHAHKLLERFKNERTEIVPYRGYGDQTQIVLRGRVLETRANEAADSDSVWANLVATYQRFESDELPGSVVRARFGGSEHDVTADDEGFFEVRLDIQAPTTALAWHTVELELIEPDTLQDQRASTTGEVFIPQPAAQFGIISDIDDTVVRTDATNILRMARNVFLGNARSRLPFPGVAALYRALHAGTPGPFVNPVFYVSSSPWNIYDMLVDFFALRGLPKGTMFLRDWGIKPGDLPFGHRNHKLAAIREIMAFYPIMPFILIGDSGQHDPEIYAEVVRLHPERIRAIYIRSVDHSQDRIAAIKQLTEEVVAAGCTLVLADDTLAMAQHAAEQGWITTATLDEVAAEKAQDTGDQSTIEALLDDEATEVIDTSAPTKAAQQVEQAIEAKEKPTIVVEQPHGTNEAQQ